MNSTVEIGCRNQCGVGKPVAENTDLWFTSLTGDGEAEDSLGSGFEEFSIVLQSSHHSVHHNTSPICNNTWLAWKCLFHQSRFDLAIVDSQNQHHRMQIEFNVIETRWIYLSQSCWLMVNKWCSLLMWALRSTSNASTWCRNEAASEAAGAITPSSHSRGFTGTTGTLFPASSSGMLEPQWTSKFQLGFIALTLTIARGASSIWSNPTLGSWWSTIMFEPEMLRFLEEAPMLLPPHPIEFIMILTYPPGVASCVLKLCFLTTWNLE